MSQSTVGETQLRIAIFSDSFLPMISGVVTALLTLAENLADRGHFVLIVTPGPNKHNYAHKNIRLESVAAIPAKFYQDFKWSAPFSLRIREVVREENIQLIHFMTPFLVSFVGINIARTLKIPLVGTFHTFISDPSNYRHFIKGKIFDVRQESVWHYSNLYYNAADINTAPAESTRREMLANGSRVDIRVISNGIDPELFDSSQVQDFRRKWGLTGKTLLYVGRVSQDKNMVKLLEAFALISKQLPEAQQLIVGDGPQLDELKRLATREPYGKQVVFTGRISHEDLLTNGLYAACDLFITASKTENQPMTILEAQANGLPCVGFSARGVPDLIADGINGRLAEPDDAEGLASAAVEVLSDPDLCRKLAEGTRRMLQRHLIPSVIDQWEDTYRDVISTFRDGGYPYKGHLHLTQLLGMLKEIHLTKPVTRSVIKPGASAADRHTDR